jgi:zinc protease
MAAPAAPSQPQSIDPATVQREVLPNGLVVLVRRDDSARAVAVNTYVKAGYFDETDDVVGVAHVLEHMFFKGTPSRGVGEIAKQTKASGGYLNAHTIYDHTSYYAVLPSAGFEAGLEIQADAYASSVIDAAELGRELEVIIQEANRKLDNPSAVVTETLYELLHDRHRIRRWRIGREAGLRQLTRDDVVRFYRNFYRPHNTVLSIVGDVDVEHAMAMVRRLYGALPDSGIQRSPGDAETAAPGFRYRELSGDVAQTQVAMGWRTPGMLHPDTPLLDLAAGVLATGRASRLYRAVRERRLASSVSAYNFTPVELGVFLVHLECEPHLAADAVRATWAQLRELRDGITPAELARLQRIVEARWLRRLETMEGQASYLAEWEAAGDWTLGDAYLERLLAADPASVAEAFARHVDPGQAGTVVYRPAWAPALAADGAEFGALLAGGAGEPLVPLPERPTAAPALLSRRAEFEREEAGVRVYRTEAGVPILVRVKPGAAIVQLGVHALGGSGEESDAQGGLTSLMAQASVKGTERRTATEIAEDGELLGGGVSASASSESVEWRISVPRRNAVAAAELLADVVQRPTFPEHAFETERAMALADLAMLRDDMFRYPMRLASRAAFAGHPYGRAVGGSEESLPGLDAAQAREWHRTRVLRSASVLAVVGDVDPDEMAHALAHEFGALTLREPATLPVPAWPERAATSAESRDKAQTALALLFPGPARGDDDRFAAGLLAGIASGLGGRFFDELRDRRSLAYTVHAFAGARRLAGTFGAYIATSPAKEEMARDGLLEEFARLRAEPVSEDELVRAQTYAIGTHAIAQQSGAAVMGDMVDAWLFGRGLQDLEKHEARVRAVTAADIQRLAQRYFDAERRVEGVVRGR